MTLSHDDAYLDYLLSQAPARKRRGCVSSAIEFLCTVAVVALAVCGGYFLLEIYVAAPAAPATVDTGADRNGATVSPLPVRNQQPVYQPAAPSLPSCATVSDTTTACVSTSDIVSPVEPTPTDAPTPTAQEGFWTAEEIAAWTATAEAYYDPATLPTAPPAFVQAVQEGCADPTKVMQSKLLQTWCGDD